MTNLDKFLEWEREKRALSYGVGGYEDIKSEMIRLMAAALKAIIDDHKNESWNPHQLINTIRYDEYQATSTLARVEELAAKELDQEYGTK